MLALCQMLLGGIYYAKNYAGLIGLGLAVATLNGSCNLVASRSVFQIEVAT